jgi:hypothetical protein
MTTPAITFVSPHPELTAIDRRPNGEAIQQLKREICVNARSAHSTQGEVAPSMATLPSSLPLSLVQTLVNFNAPDNPGTQGLHPPNSSQAQITDRNIWRAFTLPCTEFQCMNVQSSVPCKELLYVYAQSSAQNRRIRTRQYIILCTIVQTTAHLI